MSKGAYIGVVSPIYEERNKTVLINGSNISSYFTVTNGSYYFSSIENASMFVSNNKGIASSKATTTLTALSDMEIKFGYSYSTEETHDKFTLKVNNVTIADGVSGPDGVSCNYSGSLAKGQQVYLEYSKDGSDDENDDECQFYNIYITTKISTQTGEVPVARKINKGYIGIGNLARRIKRAYIGIGGVARLYMSSGELEYYGEVTPLSEGAYHLASTNIGSYAILGGGGNRTASPLNKVYAYDSALTKTIADPLSVARFALSAACNTEYAIFGGGGRNTNDTYSTQVDAYNKSLTKVGTTTNFDTARKELASISFGEYALFGGGSTALVRTGLVEAYDSALTKTKPTSLGTARSEFAAACNNKYAIFGGGNTGSSTSYSSKVEAYDKSLTKVSSVSNLSYGKYRLSAVSFDEYAIFCGGHTYTNSDTSVEVYNESLTKSKISALNIAKSNMSATTLGEYAIFGGGWVSQSSDSNYTGIVDAYTKTLTKTVAAPFKTTRYAYTAVSIGMFALFAGGYNENTNASTIVEAYII